MEGEKVTREELNPPTGELTELLLLLLEGAPLAPKSPLLLGAKGAKGDEGASWG